ncbi:MAG TPA: TatD family hydrolase [Gammaproteobacteria bacterium]|nr:TatD family hydrolase [Gammaproteobacteria bacterium]
MELVDSHCHINLLDSVETALAHARASGVKHFLCPGVDLKTTPDVLAVAEKHSDISASIGIHPNETESISINDLIKLAAHPKVVALGETGLDYYRLEEHDPTVQQNNFKHHIHAARELQKPLIIHTRDAREDTIKILKQEKASEVGGVMHCFTENWEMAQQAIDLNFYISFSGIVTFKNALELQEIAKKVPLDRMLIETDAPWLAPMPYRGKPNEPQYVIYVAKKIAELRNEAVEKICVETTANFFTLFKSAKRTF